MGARENCRFKVLIGNMRQYVLVGTERLVSICGVPISALLLFPLSLLFFVGAIEGGYGEVEEEDGYATVDNDFLVVGAGVPVGAEAVYALNEEQSENREEQSRDLQPEDAAGVDKRSPDGFAEALAAAFDPDGGGFGAGGVDGRILANGLRCVDGAVAQHGRSDAGADSKCPAYAGRLHKKSLRH